MLSGVFDEIISKLKQKAKTPEEALHILANEKLQKFYKNYKSKEWVRLEDVESAIRQIKQNCIVIEKKKLKEALIFSDSSSMRIKEQLFELINALFDEFAPLRKSFIKKELLKEC